ncbi:MAG: YabP/YqfC family sporulation protein [Clostridia bacterium]|nr:YabP/YqfC family sporulation protein [Clostridia bacterium]MBR2954213.1 YabP/YqfC family sporulation protein [Clostridia bacterium]
MARKTREKNQLKNKIIGEMFRDEPRIELTGNREVIIDGCKGVVEYTENNIRISLGENVLSLSGDNLLIQSFDNDVVIINGQISDIDFLG